MSTLAPFWHMADRPCKISPGSGCSSGFVHTFWHTSDMRSAVRSLTSLCLTVVIQPMGQVKACSTVRVFLYTHRETCSWHVEQIPRVRLSNSILESSFVQKEHKLSNWQNKPTGSTLLICKINCWLHGVLGLVSDGFSSLPLYTCPFQFSSDQW